jgi:hypothetical protein
MKKLAVLMIAGALAAAAQQNFTGVITDTMCGANHAGMKISPDSKCVTECVRHGSKYALYDGKNVYVLADQKSPEQFAGKKVKITGTLYEKTKILKADKIQAAEGAAPAAKDMQGHMEHMH